MTIKAEVRQGIDPINAIHIKDKIKKTVQSKIMVSCNAHICAYGELPRFEGKAKRIFDNRE
jgi:phenylacetate-coenzyme A ligase PaaK-like adenylate-forming protein